MLACLLVAGCAGTEVAPSSPVLDLTLNGLDGRNLELAALRGKPVLLFLFATYDPISQIALTPLLAAGKSESRVTIIGVAVQPDAKEFLGPFVKALEVPFAVYYDGSGALLHGKTKLGKLPGVPVYIAVDAEGHVQGTFYGVAKAKDLEALIDSAE